MEKYLLDKTKEAIKQNDYLRKMRFSSLYILENKTSNNVISIVGKLIEADEMELFFVNLNNNEVKSIHGYDFNLDDYMWEYLSEGYEINYIQKAYVQEILLDIENLTERDIKQCVKNTMGLVKCLLYISKRKGK